MTTDKPEERIAKPPQPATTMKATKADSVAVKDRKASSGDRYADSDAPGAEGNDPSHLAGKTFTRKVPRKP